MRIQHNIMAMNAYRNYTNNVSAMKKNLEKLSSGYKINRAGDDAAGLAISEKMRAQITGLKQAQANAKSGINLVQTAEGALTEVHDMLNRMVKLADQSANGTYDDTTDREQLQKEVTQLLDEINRIADSANFNGIQLLDGSLSTEGKASSSSFEGWDSIKGALAAGLTDVNAVKAKDTITMATLASTSSGTNASVGDKVTMTISMSDGKKYDFEATLAVDSADNTKFNLVDKDGNELLSAGVASSAAFTDANIGAAFKKAIEDSELGKTYTVNYATGKMTLEAKTAGAGPANVDSVDMTCISGGAKVAFGTTTPIAGPDKTGANSAVGADAYQSLDLSKAQILDHAVNKTSLEKATFEINGEKFVFVEKGQVTDENIAKMREAGIEHWVEVGTTSAASTTGPVAADIAKMVEKIKHATGLDVSQGTNTAGVWADSSTGTHIKINDGASSKESGGLVLQIGDTSDSWNQLRVSISDCHTKALGIDKVDISKQSSAAAAVDVIKAAINKVSDVRGTLGATQNRLDHTINNLSVMEENIQDAESTIRDTDVAEEMMAYTKNNILIQSAQAMLAQANQVPQGVLQLLQ